eukprot:Blabericola_migrator_1__4681@NODE_2473_length_2710_cov_32_560726_g1550_i0_p3_GENE_NODE_2473_length_2710_cov_32_560726_g1550_i0NODE_2473_length_2710_cov_32_560726_g1550_i0_p3_ORF_typecomplete_len168_score18_95Chromo/PF00385_24/6e08DUF1918/PF08940_11/0_22_NODE_2473_length_2710_cov_32_560726_g1550_i015232026
MNREHVQANRAMFIRVFGDVIYSIDTLKEPAFDGSLRGRVQRARMFLDVLNQVVDGVRPQHPRIPQPVTFTVDVESTADQPGTKNKSELHSENVTEEYFEIEEIRGVQCEADGTERYLVKWKDSLEMTWEPQSTIEEGDAQDFVTSYKMLWNSHNPSNPWIDVQKFN